MKRWIAAAVTTGAVTFSAVAAAETPATPRQATAIVHGLGRVFYGEFLPTKCARVYISTVDRTWASETFVDAKGCLKYGTDGVAILHIQHHRWRIVTEGSAFRCPIVSYRGQPQVPANVARDLIRYVGCA